MSFLRVFGGLLDREAYIRRHGKSVLPNESSLFIRFFPCLSVTMDQDNILDSNQG